MILFVFLAIAVRRIWQNCRNSLQNEYVIEIDARVIQMPQRGRHSRQTSKIARAKIANRGIVAVNDLLMRESVCFEPILAAARRTKPQITESHTRNVNALFLSGDETCEINAMSSSCFRRTRWFSAIALCSVKATGIECTPNKSSYIIIRMTIMVPIRERAHHYYCRRMMQVAKDTATNLLRNSGGVSPSIKFGVPFHFYR